MDCPRCHKDIADTAIECPHCHIVVANYLKKLKKKTQQPDAPPPPPPTAGSPIVYIVVGIIIAAALFFHYRGKADTAETPKPQAAAPAPKPAPAAPVDAEEILPPQAEPGEHQYTAEQAIAKTDKLVKFVPGGQFRKNMVDKE